MMIYPQTKFGYKSLNGSEDIIQTYNNNANLQSAYPAVQSAEQA